MEPRERFVAAVGLPPDELPLDVAALCIAAHAHPGLDVDAWTARIDELAGGCAEPTFDGVREHLFRRERYTGNLDHYGDPENSFLDSVIERRLGIPISLSVLMIAVGRRLGVDVRGVGMPGHFLVVDGARGDVWCDAFHGGALLDLDGCRRRFDLVYGGALAFRPSFVAPTPPAAIVARMLANLEHGELGADPVQRTWMCELHLAVPGVALDERIALAEQLAGTGDPSRAAAVLDRLADEVDEAGTDETGTDGPGTGEPGTGVAGRLRGRARSLRARMN